MSFNLSQVNTGAVIVGAVVWAVSLGAIWLVPRKDPASLREHDFMVWRNLNQSPNATFGEFLASEQAPHVYLSRAELSAAATAIALLVLVLAFHQWGVWQ
jgi:hypothetical protein